MYFSAVWLLASVGCSPRQEALPTAPVLEPPSSAPAREPAPPTVENPVFAEASNAFGFELWSHLRTSSGNQVFSPASIAVALDMAFAGARGETAEQMARVLHAPEDAATLHAGAGAALAAWNDPAREAYTLAAANRLYGERSFRFETGFLDLTRERYGAPLESVDFVRDADGSRTRINRWVEVQTRDRIRDLIPAGALTSDTRLVLVNAVYFLAKWEKPFERDMTTTAPFFAGGDREVKVPTMHRTDPIQIGDAPGLQILELPYRGSDLAMTIVLPRDRTGIEALEAQLDAGKIHTWIEGLRTARVELALPKFRIAPEPALSLGDLLREMGMESAFDGRADFSGIASPVRPEERLYLSDVFHKAFVQVDEEGTEAAAATAGSMRAFSMQVDPPIVFRADHPFLFLIRDLRSGTVLFLGRVDDPSDHA